MRKNLIALVISASLPPFNDSSTLQLIERVRRFQEYGIGTVFIGAETPQGVETSLMERLPQGSRILRTRPTTYDRTMSWLSGLRWGKKLSWIYSNLAYRVSSPDVRAGWEKQVIDLCVQLPNSLRPDIIVTHSGSFTAHIAGRRLTQLFSVPWVADLGDPLSPIDPDSWIFAYRAKRNREIDCQTIPYAAGVVFTTEETRLAYRDLLGDRLPMAIVLPCYGYEPSDFSISTRPMSVFDERIVISHIGTAHQGNRNLIPTIQALGTLEHTNVLRHSYTLNVIGPHSVSFETEAKRMNLQSASFSGRVSYQESVDWINQSNILLIVGNMGTLQIPGKVYPYLGSGRPILYIGQLPREQDPTARVLGQFPGILFARNDRDSIMCALRECDLQYDVLQREAVHRLEMTAMRKYMSGEIGHRFAEFTKQTYLAGTGANDIL